jgi:hypothetical protein
VKPDAVTARTSRSSLKSARHDKITKYFSDRFGISVDEAETLKLKLAEKKASTSKESVPAQEKELFKLPPMPKTKTSERLPIIGLKNEKLDKESKNIKTRQAKTKPFHLPSIGGDSGSARDPKAKGSSQESLKTVELPRLTQRPTTTNTTRDQKLSSLPSGGLGYTPSTDPYELKKLEALVHAAVNTSKQLLSSFDPKQDIRMKVTARHRRHTKVKRTRTVTRNRHSQAKSKSISQEEDDLDLEFGSNSTELPRMETPKVKDSTSDEVTVTEEDDDVQNYVHPEAIQALRERTKRLLQPYNPMKPLPKPKPKGPEEILAALPIQSQELVVQNWIRENGLGDGHGKRVQRPQRGNSKTSVRKVSFQTHRPPASPRVDKKLSKKEIRSKSKDKNVQILP